MKVLRMGLAGLTGVFLLTMTGCMSPEVEQALGEKDQIIANQDAEINRLTKVNNDMKNDYGLAVNDRDKAAAMLAESREALAKMQAAKKDSNTNDGLWTNRADGSISVTVLDDVLFAPGKWELTNAAAKSTLGKIADSIKKHYGDYMIRVEGYTDSDPVKKSEKVGVMEDNMDLSYWRAKSVYEALLDDKISDRMMTIACYADTSPKANKNESRRVEIVILPKVKVTRTTESASTTTTGKSTVASKK